MNIVSWNVNGIRSAREKGLFEWMKTEDPDILCLQETKANPDMLPPEFSEASDADGKRYHVSWSSAKRRGYSGVAIYSKEKPDAVHTLGEDAYDDEGRYLAADFGKLTVVSAYFPNSQEAGARLPYKLGFCKSVLAACDSLVKQGRNVVLSGDYNIAHKPIDLANPKSNEGNPGYLPEERAWMDTFLASGFTDTFRAFCGEPEKYTWWTYRFHARDKNIGWRLDYHCVNETLMPDVTESDILAGIKGSDHCPVRIRVKP